MEIWEYDFMESLLKNRRRRESLVRALEGLPEGSLVRRKRGNLYEYYLYKNENGHRSETYISKRSNGKLIESLNSVNIKRRKINNEIVFLDKIFEAVCPAAIQIKNNYYQTDKKFLPTPSQKSDTYGNLKFLTNRGEMVRSKSERFIADALFKYNLDYRYEQKLLLKEFSLHPDFTIINPLNGQTYYWEHLGMDDSEYIVDWINRKSVYNDNGIIEGKNLIVTTEKDTNSFSKIVAEIFTIKRYDKLFE